jgi:hypothetical protein
MSAIQSFARNSLAQFMTIYTEVVAESGEIDAAELERKMWAKITGGVMKSNRIPWALVKKVGVQLPYLPEIINYSVGCQALKKADGLYIPCGGKCAEDSNLCQTCTKTGAKYGQLEDRGLPGTYMDPEDKHEITYGTWLAKKEKTVEEVNIAIAEAGFEFTIPESYLAVNAKRVENKRRPGRPGAKKEVEESDDESVSSSISSKSDKPKAKKTKSDEEKPKAKPKAKKAKSDSDSDEPKVEKPKKKAKKAESESESDEPKVEKPKAKPKAKKAKSESESDEPKAEKSKKVKKAKSESESDEPKAEKPKKVKKAESDEPKAEKPKKEKAEKPKKKAEKEPEAEPEPQLAAEMFDEEIMEEIIEVGGKKYKLRDEVVVFDLDGVWVGNIEDGEVVWRDV